MKLALMQPYYFPYLGYFELIRRVDRWIVFDTAQYSRRGWIHRNRILHPRVGWQYIVCPVRQHAHSAAINEIVVDNGQKWRERTLRRLQHYRGAPHFGSAYALVEQCLAVEDPSISRLNTAILDRICAHLGIEFRYEFLSELDLSLDGAKSPGEWGLEVSAALGADEYVNLSGGRELFDPDRFSRQGIHLSFLNYRAMEYDCDGFEFVPGLSVIDALMWNRPAAIREYLDEGC